MKPTTQLIIWNAKGNTKVANIIVEDNPEGIHILESLLNLRDTDNYKYQMDPV